MVLAPSLRGRFYADGFDKRSIAMSHAEIVAAIRLKAVEAFRQFYFAIIRREESF